jgi:hypothetical protein
MTTPMNATTTMREFARGATTYDELKAQFEAATFQVRQRPEFANWSEFYTWCEELPLDTDVPEALHTATFAQRITAGQEAELLEIYRRRLRAQADD